jgi:folate-binding protein YgfZ
MNGLEARTALYAAFLGAQGRVLNDVFIYAAADGLLVDVDAQQAERLLRYLLRFKLRARLALRAVPVDEMAVWAAWDDLAEEALADALADEIGGLDRRAPRMGRRLVLPGSRTPEIDAPLVDEQAYAARRYANGVPEGQHELLAGLALPLESCLDYMGAVDFRKGCYVGQELTIRTHHTGVVRKRVLPVQLYDAQGDVPAKLEWRRGDQLADALPSGAALLRVDGTGRSVGKWLRGVGNLGLALCRLEAVGQGELMLKLESRRGPVFLRPFVPAWHQRESVS